MSCEAGWLLLHTGRARGDLSLAENRGQTFGRSSENVLFARFTSAGRKMLIYNTTYHVLFEAEEKWLEWMKAYHLPSVRQAPGVSDCTMLKLLTELDNGGSTYAVQVKFGTTEQYEAYERQYAPVLQNLILKAFPERFVSFNTLLQEL